MLKSVQPAAALPSGHKNIVDLCYRKSDDRSKIFKQNMEEGLKSLDQTNFSHGLHMKPYTSHFRIKCR